MKYQGVMLVVKDIQKAKEFYKDILELDVVNDFGANVILTNNIFLQEIDAWREFINNKEVTLQGNDKELYFEENNFDVFVTKLSNSNINFVHKVIEHSWGQRAVRFYDLDMHIIEIAEPLEVVIKRFLDTGLSVEKVAKKMDVSVAYIESIIAVTGATK
jgi:catechol 2,3-dioxygenase-like lactoylglutathione lyase family enzyme